MSVRRAYCSAVDRNVPVILRSDAAPRDRLSLHDPADLVCLDYRVRCTGWCCPLFSVMDDEEAVLAATAADDRSPDRAPAPSPPTPSESRWNRPT